MSAGPYNITIEQGSTFNLPIFVDLDLAGYTARMQIRPKIGEPSVADLTTQNGGLAITPNGSNWTITVKIPAAASAAWPRTFKRGVYDLEIVNSVGEPTRLLKGTVTVDPEVTTI